MISYQSLLLSTIVLNDNVNNYMLQGAHGLSVHESASVHAGQGYIAAEFRTPFR